MRLEQPRLRPLADEELPEQAKIAFGDGPILNIFRTLAHHPDLMRRWLVFGNHVLGKSTLPPRERELAILRVGYLCQSGYEWGQHVRIGLDSGLTQDEIDRIPQGSAAEGWSELDRAILDATDELHDDAFITEATWQRLGDLSDPQKVDLIFAVGQYNLVSMALNSLGVQPEVSLPALPPRTAR